MTGHRPWAEVRAEIEAERFKRWYQYGWRSPEILFARFKNKHHNLFHPIFRVRMVYQRVTRGVSIEDSWGLNHHLARVIVHGVKDLRMWETGYPTGLKSWEEWDGILARIEGGFQAWLDDDGWFVEKPEQEAKFKNGMELFAFWFSGLWD